MIRNFEINIDVKDNDVSIDLYDGEKSLMKEWTKSEDLRRDVIVALDQALTALVKTYEKGDLVEFEEVE